MKNITINDLRDSSLQSGFKNVNAVGNSPNAHGQKGDRWRARSKGGKEFTGPARMTAIEAAHDYVNWVNRKPLTIDDIRNPKRKSGFDHVSGLGGTGTRAGWTPTWRAEKGAKPARVPAGKSLSDFCWRGPARQDPVQAAQDYCDYINAQQAAPATVTLKQDGAGAARDRIKHDSETKAALGILRDKKAQREGKPTQVYLIGTDLSEPVKIGYSCKPEARVREFQSGNPKLLKLLASQPGGRTEEAALHAKYIKQNVRYEWFTPSESLLSEFGLNAKKGA